jgi:hypothetical protein
VSVARFKVPLQRTIDGATAATVTVDRASGVAIVRLYRRRAAFYVSLADVVGFVVWRAAKSAAAEKAKAKRLRRRKGGAS